MARTLAQWRTIIIDKKNSESNLAGVDSSSAVAEWSLWVDVVAFCAFFLDGLFDSFKSAVNALLAADKSHTLGWYVTKAKAFQYGVSLPADTDVYAVVPPADDSVLIVSSAAAIELPETSKVRLKVAKGEPGDLSALGTDQLNALRTYMGRIKDAGVRLEVTSSAADTLKLGVELFYDPLIIAADGSRIDGTASTPALDAINAFLADMPFNGVFVLNDLIDAVEAVEGLVICRVITATGIYATFETTITAKYTPDAGYMAVDEVYFAANVIYTPN